MRNRKSCFHAFTLIELLVTIGIISILASLLLTGINNSKNAAHATKCRSNLKQIQLAMCLYVQDTEYYPVWGQDYAVLDEEKREWWFNTIKPYTGQGWTDPLYRCPSYRGPTTKGNSFGGPHWGSYGLNQLGVWRPKLNETHPENLLGLEGMMKAPSSTYRTPFRATDIKVPSDMIAVGDAFRSVWKVAENRYGMESNGGEIGINAYQTVGLGTIGSTPEYRRTHGEKPEDRHGGKLNVTFCDGHVEAFKYRKLYLEFSPDIMRKWNRDHEPHDDRLPGRP